MKKILITGDSGFIGSHLTRHFVNTYSNYVIHGLDSLTYAANRSYLQELESHPNYIFHKLDIRNRDSIMGLFKEHRFTDVIHLAAESHVDNSISNPLLFAETNILGTLNLLDAFKLYSNGRFQHVSTDEVYGDLTVDEPPFEETTPYQPSSPYSASKSASDHFVRAYYRTFGLNITITNCSNNYGPHQHMEKFIPTVILSILNNKQIPIYGNGQNIRDWLYVLDHVDAIDSVFHKGDSGQTYNISGDNELSNINLVEHICDLCSNKDLHHNPRALISFVEDRLGHDTRYAINSNKIKNELNWSPRFNFIDALSSTIDWYVDTFR